jgi:hypothetical protein
MKKPHAFCGLFYGSEYLREAVGAVSPYVEKVHLLYTSKPSFGQSTELTNPDTFEILKERVDPFGDQIVWHHGTWRSEGEQHQSIFPKLPDVETFVRFDSDEVWNEADLSRCIEEAQVSNAKHFPVRGFSHFWRSFSFACTDVWNPLRIIKPRGNGEQTLEGKIYHFGYGQSSKMVQFKFSVSVHKPELRPEWWQDIFLANRREDCHPTCLNWWRAEPFDKTTVPASLKAHANYSLDLIP